MVVKVGINGFGRIGRVIFRTCKQKQDLEVSAINDPAVDIEYICYLIKFDSTHGKFKSEVSFSNNEICIDDKKIKVFSEKLPSDIPWQDAEVQYVVEASGMFTNLDKASGHLSSKSVKRVIVTAPTVDVPMLILGVNKDHINKDQKVISCASSTLYCLAPIIKILEDNFGVAEGFITSIHAMTPSLKPLDGLCLKGKHWRDHRSIHQNIIPAATGACRALSKIIPSVKDKLTGLAFRVPIVNVSVLDITVRLTKNTTMQDIIKCVETESKTTMKNIIKISKDQEVSSDFLGDENSCIFDVNSSLQLNPKFFKLICWYENEYSYACRVVDSIKYVEENLKLISKIPFDCVTYSNNTVKKKPIPHYSKEYIISNCHMHSNPKILFSSSLDTGFKVKPPEQQVTWEIPSPFESSRSNQLDLRQTKLNNDDFNVWNDEIQLPKTPVKENRNSIFQSCVTLGPSLLPNNNSYQTTKKRLEEVQKGFTKMVNMTENLLKKTSQSKSKIDILEEEFESEFKKKQMNYEFYKTRSQLPLTKSFPTSGIFQASINKVYKDVFKTHKKASSNMSMVKNIREFNYSTQVVNKDQIQNLESTCNDICDHSKIHIKKPITSSDSEVKEVSNSKKVNESFILQQNVEKTICNFETANLVNNNEVINQTSVIEYDVNQGSPDNFTKKLSEHDYQRNEIKKLSPKNSSLEIKSEDNISNKSNHNKELTLTYIKPETLNSEESKVIKRDGVRKKIIEGIMKILAADALEDKARSPSLVNTNTTLSNGDPSKSIDIYDKIDSASGTDSENSFQINEKTSQIIDIKDLTSSTEELARLDKICRIIEISDEMSDKLFSALDNKDTNIRKKKWSFKDLCEKLNLDEFCDNVFGHSQI